MGDASKLPKVLQKNFFITKAECCSLYLECSQAKKNHNAWDGVLYRMTKKGLKLVALYDNALSLIVRRHIDPHTGRHLRIKETSARVLAEIYGIEAQNVKWAVKQCQVFIEAHGKTTDHY